MAATALDDCLTLLADGRRRRLVRHLRTAPDTFFTVEELAADPGWTAGEGDTAAVDADRLAADLHHRHLPALQEHGVVSYGNGTARYRSDERVEAILDALAQVEHSPRP